MGNKATVKIDSKYNPKGTNEAKQGQEQLQKQTASTSSTLLKASAIIAGVTLAYNAAKNKVNEFSKASAANEEIQSKFNVVFEDQSRIIQEWAANYSDAVGRSESDTLKFLASMKDLLTPMGFVKESAISLSTEIVTLTNDIGSFNDLPTASVLRDIQAAMTGGGETVKKYGVIVNVATIKQEALSSGIWDGTEALNAQQKAQAAWQLIVKGSTAAQGDLLRTQESHTNVTIKNEAAQKDLNIILGNITNRGITPYISAVTRATQAVTGWLEAIEKLKKPSIDINIALDALANQTANTNQEILAHQTLLEELRQTYQDLADDDPSSRALPTLEKQITAKEELIALLKQELVWIDKNALAVKNAGEAEAKAAVLKKQNQDDIVDFVKRVNDAYALTEQGREDALRAEIAMFENMLTQADVTVPKIELILEMYREQLRLMTEIANVTFKEFIPGRQPGDIPIAAESGEAPLPAVIEETISGFDELAAIIPIVAQAMTLLASPIMLILPFVKGLTDVLLPALIEVIAPLIGILVIWGRLIGSILIPVMNLLIGPIQLLANIFVWLYNVVLRPFGNAVIGLVTIMGNGFIGIINSIIKLINKIPGVNIKKVKTIDTEGLLLDKISLDDVTAAGTDFFGDQGFDTGDQELDTGALAGSRTTVQRVPDIFVHNNLYGDIYGAGGVVEFGEVVVQSIQAYVGVGGKVTFQEVIV